MKLENARAAKTEALRQFGDLPCVNGIGLSRRGSGFAVKINLEEKTDVVFPNKINGVDIVVDVVGKIRKLAPKQQSVAYHVLPHDGRWAIRRQGAQRVSSTYKTQREAIGIARERARKQRGELVVHARDGSVRNRDSYGKSR